MSLQNTIIASVLSNDVFRRFAQVSDEDKSKIIDKVKEKVNGNGNGDEEAKEDATPDTKEEVVEETDEKTEKKAPAKKKEDASEEDAAKTEDGDDAKGIEDIVGDLVEEIEVIKSDGQIAPGEVLGLIDNMVQMVTTLLGAKPGRARKSSVAQRIRREVIAERVIR